MMIFWVSSSPSFTLTTFRFSSPTPLLASTSRISCSAVSTGRRRSRCPCILFCASKMRGMTEMLDDKKTSNITAAAATTVASSSASDRHEISPSRTFLDTRSEQDLLLGIQKETQAERLPMHVAQGMEELYQNYRNAILVFQSGHPKADEIALSNMAVALDPVFMDVRDPFEFSPHHEAIRESFDYYMFGQKYIRPLIDFRSSYVGNISLFNEMEKKLQQARFDALSVDNMRRLAEHAGIPGHIYPLAILCYDIMPPPAQVETEIGEKRIISFHGVGISVGPEISYNEITADLEDPEEAKAAYSQSLYSSVEQSTMC